MPASNLINLDGVLTKVTQDGAADPYNTPTATTTTAAVKCWYQQTSSSENTADTNQQTQTHDLFFRAGTDVTGFDSLAVDGFTFQILGPPWPAKNPRTQIVSHVEARGRQVV